MTNIAPIENVSCRYFDRSAVWVADMVRRIAEMPVVAPSIRSVPFALTFGAALGWSGLANASYADDVDDLIEVLRLDEMIAIMRDEGLEYADELAAEMFLDGSRDLWRRQVNEIYDANRMHQQVESELRAGLGDGTDLSALIDFYRSDLGRNIVSLELEARAAMTDSDVEEAALDAFSELDGSDDAGYLAVTDFVQGNDLIGMNVSGTLNSMYQFYSGLADGGVMEVSETELLDQIWSQEPQIAEETHEWIFAYLLLAYGPLDSDQVQTYTALSTTPEGRRLNTSLFAGFNSMYDGVSYALGRAAAEQMGVQEL